MASGARFSVGLRERSERDGRQGRKALRGFRGATCQTQRNRRLGKHRRRWLRAPQDFGLVRRSPAPGVARHGVLAPPPAGPGSLPALKEVQTPSSYTHPLPSRAPAPCGSPTSPVPASAVGIALDLHRRHPLHFGGVLPREFDGLQDLHLPVHPVRLGGGARAHPAAQAWPRARARPGPRARVLRGSALLLRWTWLQGSGGSGRVTPGPGPDTLISCPARARCAAT